MDKWQNHFPLLPVRSDFTYEFIWPKLLSGDVVVKETSGAMLDSIICVEDGRGVRFPVGSNRAPGRFTQENDVSALHCTSWSPTLAYSPASLWGKRIRVTPSGCYLK